MRALLHALVLLFAAALFSTTAASAQCVSAECGATPVPSASPTPIPIVTGNASDAYTTLTTFISKLTNVGADVLEGPNGTGVEASALTAALMGAELGIAFFVFFWGFKTLGLPVIMIPTIRSVIVGCFLLVVIQAMPQFAQTLLTMPCYLSNGVTQGLTQHSVDCQNAAGNDFAIINEGVQYSGDLLHVQMKDAAGSTINPFSAATDIVGMVLAGAIAMVAAFVVLIVFLAIGIAVILAKLVLNAVCFIGVIRLPWLVLQSVPLVRDEAMGTVQTAIKTSFGLLGIWIAYGLGEGLVGSYFDNIAANGATLADLLIAPLIPIVWLVVSAVLMWLLVRCAKGVGFSVESVAGSIVRAGLGAGLNLASGFAGAAGTLGKMAMTESAMRRSSGLSGASASGTSVKDDIEEAKFSSAAMIETRRPRALGPGRDDGATGGPAPNAPADGGGGGNISASDKPQADAAQRSTTSTKVVPPAAHDAETASTTASGTTDAILAHVDDHHDNAQTPSGGTIEDTTNGSSISAGSRGERPPAGTSIAAATSTLAAIANDGPPLIRSASAAALRSMHVAAAHASSGATDKARSSLQHAHDVVSAAASTVGLPPQTAKALHESRAHIAKAITHVGGSTSSISAQSSDGEAVSDAKHLPMAQPTKARPKEQGAELAPVGGAAVATSGTSGSGTSVDPDAIDVPFRAIGVNTSSASPATESAIENMRRQHLAVARSQLRRGLLGAAFTSIQGMHEVVNEIEGASRPRPFGTGAAEAAKAGQRAADIVTFSGNGFDANAMRVFLADGESGLNTVLKDRARGGS